MTAQEFHAARRFLDVEFGRIAYVERGRGPAALFLHGVPLNGFHWRHVIEDLADVRRCIALDLMGLGYSEIAPDQDVSFTAQAGMVAACLDALHLDQVDLVCNDSGGAVGQIFAASNADRLRTLTLTNCDVHDNWPPAGVLPLIETARAGASGAVLKQMLDNPVMARSPAAFGVCYEAAATLTDEALRVYLEPLVANTERSANVDRYLLAMDCRQTVEIEPQLKQLEVPTLILWGDADVFFHVRWAHWLRQTIPGVKRVIELPNGRLFFPEEHPSFVSRSLREFWGC